MRPHGPPVLDEKKRNQIIALLTHGCSRRVAARYVGCAPSTITRTAMRDPEFNQQVAQAEGNCQMRALRTIWAAAKTGRYWRAAAWLLERVNSEDFADPTPRFVTEKNVKQAMNYLIEMVLKDQSKETYLKVVRQMDALLGIAPVASPYSQFEPLTHEAPIVNPDPESQNAKLDFSPDNSPQRPRDTEKRFG